MFAVFLILGYFLSKDPSLSQHINIYMQYALEVLIAIAITYRSFRIGISMALYPENYMDFTKKDGLQRLVGYTIVTGLTVMLLVAMIIQLTRL
ncbi:hypothetical protein HOD15_02270 [Candidatus Peregrinibacteria bacterium]|nr:hypothetical protein [Candidatus Peregrinibacteria bacterium]